jgi:hypothetical protein
MKKCPGLVAALGLAGGMFIVPAPPAAGWNSSGHMIAALIAFGRLDAATQAKSIALIRAHPRFEEHFVRMMPREVSRASEQDQEQWYFAHASTWPDVVRSPDRTVTRADVDRFSRPWWHFVDLPIYLSDENRSQLDRRPPFNLSRELPVDRDDPDMNVIQAIKNSSRIVGDAATPMDQRAIHLCWLLHLVGDSHQPLHSSALLTAQRFRGGDQGGNLLEIEHGWKLHAFWDEQVSTEAQFATLQLLAGLLARNAELNIVADEAAERLDPGAWIDEGHVLAKKYVYTPEVIARVAAREGHSHLGPLDLSAGYKADAEMISERLAVVAAHRMARILQELLQ